MGYMSAGGVKASGFLKIGVVLFCFMCLFFATYMTSKYEHQKTKTEIQIGKLKELEENIRDLSTINQELLQICSALVQEKEHMAKEINSLREKHIESEGWKHAIGQETLEGDFATNQQLTDTDDVKKRLFDGEKPSKGYTHITP